MTDISALKNQLLQTLTEKFGERLWFVGLQGSHARDEATETSDIDFVVILDTLSTEDIRTYNSVLDSMPHRELFCGFMGGKDELLNWEPSDLFQFYYDTKPLKGSLDELLPLIDSAAVDKAIKTGVCNIYHGCVHNMLYEKSDDILKGLYKSASFVAQAICFRQTGNYISRQKDLLPVASPQERLIVETFLELKRGEKVNFDKMSTELFKWTKNQINTKETDRD